MTYKEFIRYLKECETADIQVLSFPDSCAVDSLPDSFGLIFSDIVNFLQNHLVEFCGQGEVLALFGMQVVAGRITSSLPQRLNRIYYTQRPNDHFCCALNYLVLPAENESPIHDWRGYQSLFIDFTTGKVMDSNHYLFLMNYHSLSGKIYGELNSNLLEKAWQSSCTVIEENYHEKIRAYS